MVPLGQICVSGHEGNFQRGFEVFALGEMCSEGMCAFEKGVSGVGTA